MENQKLLKNLNSKGRLLALLLTLTAGLLYCSSAWAWNLSSGDYYYDDTETQWGKASMTVGHGSNASRATMSRVTGTKDLYKCSFNGWNNAVALYLSSYTGTDYCENILKVYYIIEHGKGEASCSWDSDPGANSVFKAETTKQDCDCNAGQYKGQKMVTKTSYSSYKVTISNGAGGSISVKDYDDKTVSTNTDKSYLTVLKIKVTPNENYDVKSLTVGGTDYTSQAKTGFNYTMKAATSIVVTYKNAYTPTVLIGAKESVSDENVTLNGYIKYTGCETVSSYGFVYGLDEGGEPTYDQQAEAGTDDVSAGTDFSTTFAVQESGTYNYRAYMTTSGGTYYSEERRQFTVDVACDITTTVNATFEDGSTTASATFTDGSASIGVKSTNHSQYFQWVCESKPDGANATFEPQGKRTSTITVNMVGQYTIKLQGKCNESDNWIDSEILTLNVCAPAEFTQLYLDNHTNNVLCLGEEATATCITKDGYTYTLYNPAGTRVGEPLEGSGATQTWRHVTGAGEFTMRTSPTSMPYCAAVVSSATQSYNEPTLEIIADTDLNNVINYQPVILSKKNVTSDTYVDTNPTWVISTGADKGYLLNEHNRLAYDNRAREKVVFKGGAASEATIKVQASAYKTVNVVDPDEKVENYTKQCPTTTEVTLTVSPAEDDCD